MYATELIKSKRFSPREIFFKHRNLGIPCDSTDRNPSTLQENNQWIMMALNKII